MVVLRGGGNCKVLQLLGVKISIQAWLFFIPFYKGVKCCNMTCTSKPHPANSLVKKDLSR